MRRKALLWAVGCAAAVFVVGSLLPIWSSWEATQIRVRGEVIQSGEWRAVPLWGALGAQIQTGGWHGWGPDGNDHNLIPTAALLFFTCAAAVSVYIVTIRHQSRSRPKNRRTGRPADRSR